jgi:putative hydrolase of the HAD superfamily
LADACSESRAARRRRIFHLPDHERIRRRVRARRVRRDVDVLDRAHYAGAAQFRRRWVEIDWKTTGSYLDAYITSCGVGDDPSIREEVHTHLDSEFAVGDLWSRIIPGSVDGLRALVATGVHVGIISNADGTVAQRLAAQEVLQVGPGSASRSSA